MKTLRLAEIILCLSFACASQAWADAGCGYVSDSTCNFWMNIYVTLFISPFLLYVVIHFVRNLALRPLRSPLLHFIPLVISVSTAYGLLFSDFLFHWIRDGSILEIIFPIISNLIPSVLNFFIWEYLRKRYRRPQTWMRK
jgi:hypothetical protein